MTNKGISFFLSILLSISILTVCPFSISADTTIVPTFSSGMQTKWNDYGGHITEYHESGTNINGISTLRFTFDDHYYGYFGFTYFFGNNSTYAYGEVFIADGYGEYNYRNASNGSTFYVTAVRIDYGSLVIPDSNVDLTQIIDLLTAIQTSTHNTDINTLQTITQIQNVISQLIISNGYQNELVRLNQLKFPIESFNIVYQCMNNSAMEMVGISGDNYIYPIFSVPANTKLSNNFGNGAKGYIIFWLDKNIVISNDSIYNYMSFSNITIDSMELLGTTKMYQGSSVLYGKLIKLNVTYGAQPNEFRILQDSLFMPVYWNDVTNRYISTDFALQFGLSNRFLDDINIIANGTQQSSSAAGANDSATNDFNDVAGDMYDYEDNFNGDMNQSLNQIDTNFNIGSSFGSNFSASAQWVSQQFNQLTSSTPFGSVLSFSLLLGLALLIVGKVLR